MANNRLYLKCPFCGECVLIGKSMGMNFYTPYTGDPPKYEQRIQEFFEKHWECYIHSDKPINIDGGIFALEDEQGTYESDTFGKEQTDEYIYRSRKGVDVHITLDGSNSAFPNKRG